MKKKFIKSNSISYKKAGVDIEKSEKILNDLKQEILSTFNDAVIDNFGGFSSVLDINKLNYNDPLLLSATDGVGTKLKLAIEVQNFDYIGIDLVAMCVNDILTHGGLPHFFLDYIAVGKLQEKQIKAIIKSIIRGCIISNCALVGGETAEMPGHYLKNNFDIAGFAIGAVERNEILTPSLVKEGDTVIAVESNGIHSNGYSLIRKLIEHYSIDIINEKFEFNDDKNIAETLLKPTFIYTDLIKKKPKNLRLHGISHITGGGLIENPKRSFGNDLSLVLDCSTFNMNPLFLWIKEKANLNWHELFQTFNCGIGLLVYVDKQNSFDILNYLQKLNFSSWIVGEMKKKNINQDSIQILNYEKN